ncbi:PREDICTED: hybrid signal transduction histidine kinase D isoform [Prunus dulcis]|uniref:PREDICTED: hybrid signal transduction histidine kinase D isoform n=1 Tax=Prunus dulcis TaxID=3755 RepID=A0A5E4GLS0_PRUDU|nr:PREDICTED: hybrid signal transduction histidine kinase D isoform [Prunus dulcis]
MERFLLRLKHIRDQLASAGVPISDDDFMITILNGLPLEYDMIKTVLIARDSLISLKDFCAQLLAANRLQSSDSHSPCSVYVFYLFSWSGVAPSWFFFYSFCLWTWSIFTDSVSKFHFSWWSQVRFGDSSSKFYVVPKCQICGKRGHTAANCYHRHGYHNSKISGSIIACQMCGKKGHGALDCFHRSNYVYQGQAPPSTISAMTAHSSYMPTHAYAPMTTHSRQEMADHVWIADIGASHHMVADVSTLHDLPLLIPLIK